MSSEKHPYKLIQYRLDVVARVPSWAKVFISKGAEVIRLDAETVVLPGNGKYWFPESYTKFKGYTEPF
jgi:hypothetical protein